MVKKGLIIVIILVLTISTLNMYFYFNKGKFSYSALSGGVTAEIPKIPLKLDISTIAFIIQWVIVLIIIIIAYVNHLKGKKEETVRVNYNQIKIKKSKSGTDLDIFYEILKSKRRVKTGTIAKIFKISKEKALEWAKILENHDLAIIEYPAFNDPEVRINEKA